MTEFYNGLREAQWGSEKEIQCANILCERMLVKGSPFFWDTVKNKDYCEQCGQCLRYKRKKAVQRGETIESVRIEE